MSIVKISALSVLSVATGTTVVPAVDNNITKKLSLDGIANYVISDIAVSTLTAVNFAATSNGAGTNFKVGDDAWIGDVNSSNAIRITGIQDPTKGYIIFGNGNNTVKLGRSGNGPVTLNGILSVNTLTLNNDIILSAGSKILDSDGETALGFASVTDSGYTVDSTILGISSGFTVAGDATGAFTPGLEIQFESIAGAEFTVATSTYTEGTNSTDVILVSSVGFGPVDGDKVYLEYHGITEIYPGANVAFGISDSNTGRVLTIDAVTQQLNYIANGTSGVVIAGENGSVTISVADFGVVAEFSTSTITTYVPIQTGVFTVNNLPLASDAGAGARAFVTNATSQAFNAPAVDAGGGGYGMPVFSNGSGWFIG